jgi:hypothetical protein
MKLLRVYHCIFIQYMTFIQLKRKRRGGERERGREEKERRESVSVSEIGISLPIPANHTPALLAPIPQPITYPSSLRFPYLCRIYIND